MYRIIAIIFILPLLWTIVMPWRLLAIVPGWHTTIYVFPTTLRIGATALLSLAGVIYFFWKQRQVFSVKEVAGHTIVSILGFFYVVGPFYMWRTFLSSILVLACVVLAQAIFIIMLFQRIKA